MLSNSFYDWRKDQIEPYPLKHWLFTIILGPACLIIYEIILSSLSAGMSYLSWYFPFIIVGMFMSTPFLALYYIVFKLISKRIQSSLMLRAVLDIFAIGCVVLTFIFIGGSDKYDLGIAYSASVIISSLFLNVKPKNNF